MSNQIISSDKHHLLIPINGSKDALSRMTRYATWLNHQGLQWYEVNLDRYRDVLTEQLSPASVQAHLSTIRGHYQKLMLQRDLFFAALPNDILAKPFHEQKAYVDEMMERLKAALKSGQVKMITKQDKADSEHLRLTTAQANELIRQPGIDTLLGLRNTAMIALMLATGIREQELCNLNVRDLRQRFDGELSLRVTEGKGKKQRLIPYGDNQTVLRIVDRWLGEAEINTGYVFRGIVPKGTTTLNEEPLTTRAVQRILKAYPVMIDGNLIHVQPHDLRRTYARRQFDAGMELTAIQQNLGHAKIETTLAYIGKLDAKQRRSKATFDFEL